MAQISILGCGWLGLPLAEALVSEGFSVKGSTTSAHKISLLASKGVKPFLVSLSEDGIVGDISRFLDGSEILVIDIPPKLRKQESESFVSKIQNLLSFIEKSSIEKVLFVSSTSVFADDNSIIDEKSIPNPDTESGKQLLEVEKIIGYNSCFKTTILRFGGLIGDDRHPVKFLAGKENIENPEAPINLIHLEDCIGIIKKIIEKQSWSEVFNAVTPFHPSRENYYHKKAQEMNLPLPKFVKQKPSVGKLISSTKIENNLGYSFRKSKL